jgi:hypothetical protein
VPELNLALLDAFFEELARRVPSPVKVILTGGAEALLLGSSRPTADIDFGIALSVAGGTEDHSWGMVEAAVAEASRAAGVAVQYSADIDRWSMVAMPNYRRHTQPYRRYGRVTVHLLEPAYWAVPKLARYLDTDQLDLQVVLQAQRVQPQHLARVCGRALRASPRSTALFLFRQHVEDFLRTRGASVWGEGFDAEAAVTVFHRAAGIR